ncbi:glycosyltransferase [Candidatus Flexifilum breve]|uniref:glycosyltransferase n=1 Tax=Candidatus Flexifilum breve TaxID=3140694 RepID=UPI0031CC8AB8
MVNEALYHGVPCVVSDRVGCAPDLIQPGVTGEVFAADAVDSLADALRRAFRLLDQPGTADRCRALVAQYSVEAAARGLAQAYAEVTAP